MIWSRKIDDLGAENRPRIDFYCPFFPIYCRKIENRAKIFTNSLFEYLFGQFSTKRGARKGGLERTGKRPLWSPARPKEARGFLGVLPSLLLPPLHILFLFLEYILLCPFYRMEPSLKKKELFVASFFTPGAFSCCACCVA
mgnify:CR=1 FL=1